MDWNTCIILKTNFKNVSQPISVAICRGNYYTFPGTFIAKDYILNIEPLPGPLMSHVHTWGKDYILNIEPLPYVARTYMGQRLHPKYRTPSVPFNVARSYMGFIYIF